MECLTFSPTYHRFRLDVLFKLDFKKSDNTQLYIQFSRLERERKYGRVMLGNRRRIKGVQGFSGIINSLSATVKSILSLFLFLIYVIVHT